MQSIAQILASELGQPVQYVENVIALLDQGRTDGERIFCAVRDQLV